MPGGQDGIDWFATLADPQNTRVKKCPAIRQLHYLSRRGRAPSITLVLMDTSGSLVSRGALSSAKGAVAGLCQQAYLQRQPLELVGFGGDTVKTLQAARKPAQNVLPLLDTVGAGGGTPLRQALQHASKRLAQLARQNPVQPRRLFIFTDARSRDSLDNIELNAEITVIDTEQTAVKIGKARRLAAIFNANYRHIDTLPLL